MIDWRDDETVAELVARKVEEERQRIFAMLDSGSPQMRLMAREIMKDAESN